MDGKQQGWSEAVKWTKGRRDNRAVEREAIIWIQCQDRKDKTNSRQSEVVPRGVILVLPPGDCVCVCFSSHLYQFSDHLFSLLHTRPAPFWLPSLSLSVLPLFLLQSELFLFSSLIQLCGCLGCYFRQVHHPSTHQFLLCVCFLRCYGKVARLGKML